MSAFDKPKSAGITAEQLAAALAALPTPSLELPGELHLVETVPQGYALVEGLATVARAAIVTPIGSIAPYHSGSYAQAVRLSDGTTCMALNCPSYSTALLYTLAPGATSWTDSPLPYAYSSGGPFSLAVLPDDSLLLSQADITDSPQPVYRKPKGGAWSNIGTNPHAMGQSTAATLSDGSILFIGGCLSSTGRQSVCSRYVHGLGFDLAPAYPIAASAIAAGELGDGRVLTAGGETGNQSSASTAQSFIYTPGVGWERVGDLPYPVQFADIVTIGAFSYLVGGRRTNGTGNPNILVFSHASKTWAVGPDATGLVSGGPAAGAAALAMADGSILVAAGNVSSAYYKPGKTFFYVSKTL